jgi:hypothetical protein
VATSDSSLGTPDWQALMTTNETPGPSWTVHEQYLEDISADELSANAPADETEDQERPGGRWMTAPQ